MIFFVGTFQEVKPRTFPDDFYPCGNEETLYRMSLLPYEEERLGDILRTYCYLPSGGYAGEEITADTPPLAVCRIKEAEDSEPMVLFGWPGTRPGSWRPFFKIALADLLVWGDGEIKEVISIHARCARGPTGNRKISLREIGDETPAMQNKQ